MQVYFASQFYENFMKGFTKDFAKKIAAVLAAAIVVVIVSVFIVIPYLRISTFYQLMDQIQTMPGFEGSTVVVNAKYEGDKDSIISKNMDILVHPGSNYKLLTAAAALHYLGMDFVFKTDFYTFKMNGKLNLLIKGYGDPTLRVDNIQSIAAWLKGEEIFIDGSLFYDDSYFTGEKYGPDWKKEWKDIHFAVPISALQIGDNLLYIEGMGSSFNKNLNLESSPLKNYKPILDERVLIDKNKVAGWDQSKNVTAVMKEDGTVVIVGETAGDNDFSTSTNIKDPSLLTARVFKQEFVDFGVMKESAQVLPITLEDVDKGGYEKKMVYEYKSASLSEIVKRMLTFSKNNYGETLIRVLGEEADEDSLVVGSQKGVGQAVGNQAKGVEVLRKFLTEKVGILPGDFVGKDGSGMSPSSRITGRAIFQLFDYVDKQSWKDVYWNAFPTSNNEGTLHYRFLGLNMSNLVIAKTGTHEFASSLSGKILREDKPILFDIHIYNHHVSSSYVGNTVHPVIDMIVKALDERL